MLSRMFSAIQALVEYGAVTGAQVTQPTLTGPARVGAWATQHQTAIIATLAGVALFWMVRAASRR
jgi:hypothetical protein